MKCHFEYKGQKYDELNDLYPIILGEIEAKQSVVDIKDENQDKIEVKDSSPIKEITVLPFTDFVKENPLTEQDRELATTSLESSAFFAGKDLLSSQGKITIRNLSPNSSEIFSMYKKDDEDFLSTNILKSQLIDIVAHNLKYEQYIASVEPQGINDNPTDYNAPIPSNTELEDFMKINYLKDNFESDKTQQDIAERFKQFGYNPANSSFSNIKAIVSNISLMSDSPIKSYLADKILANIDKFSDLELILDTNLNRRGVANINTQAEGYAMSIRINPLLITSKESYVETILEELVHSMVFKETRNPNSESVANLRNLHQQVIANFGKENLANYQKIINKLEDLKVKERSGIALTEEEQTYKDIKTEVLNTIPNIRRLVYRLGNFDEFIAGVLMDSSFQSYLNNIKETDTNKSLWSKFLDIIFKLVQKFGLKEDRLLKYALNDSLFLVKEGLENVNGSLGKVLNNKYTRSKNFVNNKFNLVDGNNNLVKLNNGKAVADFINSNFTNITAFHDPETKTVKLHYTDEVKNLTLSDIRKNLNSYDPVGDSLFGDDTEYLNDDTFFAEGNKDSEKQFKLQTKVYATNLNDRLNSLYKSKRIIQEEQTDSKEELNNQFAKLEKVNAEIDKVKGFIRQLTPNSGNPLKGLIDLNYQGSDELDNVKELLTRPLNSSDIKYILQTVKFWTNAKKFIFTPRNLQDPIINDKYTELEGKANKVALDVDRVLGDYILNNIVKKNNASFNGTVTDLAKEFVDLSQFRSLIDDLGVTNSTLLNTIATEIKNQNEIRQQELHDKLKHFEDVTKKAVPFLKTYASNKKDIYEIFRQLDGFGRKTRNMVSRVSYEYQQEKRKALNFVYDNKKDRGRDEAFNALTFLHQNTEQVDYNKLFPIKETDYNEEDFNAEYDRIKAIIGEKHMAEWFAKQNNNIQEYKKYRDFKVDEIVKAFNLDSEDAIEFNDKAQNALYLFEEANSPYLIGERLTNYDAKTNPFRLKYNYQSFKYIEDIPKKEIKVTKDGKSTTVSSYDEKYKQIEKVPQLDAYYHEIMNALKDVGSLIPYETGEKLASNALPEFRLAMYDTLLHGGMGVAKDVFREQMADSIRTEKYESTNKVVDVITGKEKKSISVGLSTSNNKINDEVKNRILQYKIDNNTAPTEGMVEDWRSEITEKYAEEMDFDLSKVLQKYITLGVAYKHKAILEDSLILAQEMFGSLREYERDNKGKLQRDVTNINAITYLMKSEQDSFVNSKKVLDHTIKSVLFHDTRNVDSGKKKILTKAEKRHKAILEQTIKDAKQALADGKLTPEEYEIGVGNLTKQINSLGAYLDKEKVWDIPLKWTQYKGMGWNIIGGISNMIFGYASNLIESAGQEFYSESDLAKAYAKVMMNSAVRNASFNKSNGFGGEANKIRAIMDRFDIMAESGSEYNSLVGQDITERLKFLSAFNVNARTEYINQAPLMLVSFDKAKFEHNGKEYSIYEGFDDAGEWNTEKFGAYPDELVRKTVLKTKALVQRNHGNYNAMSPILAKRSSLGRLFLQFRTWMLEGIRTRFFDKDGRYDPILETIIKGRYISAYDIFANDFKGAGLGLGLQVLRNFIPFKNAFGLNGSPLEKQLAGNENIKDYDIANMKRVAMEINMFIGMYTVLLALRSMAGDWDDDDPKKYAVNLLLNQGTRLRTDLLMYINPTEAKKLIQDPVPSMKILSDFYKFKDAVVKTIIDGSPEYETGINQGKNRILRTFFNQIPVANKVYNVQDNMFQDYDK